MKQSYSTIANRWPKVTVSVVLSYAVLVITGAAAIAPLLWALSTSVKTTTQVVAYPPRWLPDPPTFESYLQVVWRSPMPRHLLNTLIVAGISIALVLTVATHCAYGIARLRLRNRELLSFSILATAMVPIISVLPPLYSVYARLGLDDSYLGLSLVYSAWQVPTAMILVRGFIEAIPRELEEAAMIDGCSRRQCLYRIVFPIIQPGLVAAALLIFIYVWNDFLVATTLAISDERRMIQVGLYQYIGDVGIDWGRFMAYTVLASLPIIVLFLSLQRRLLRGLVAGAMKG